MILNLTASVRWKQKHEELNLGDIISDAYVYAVENTGESDGEKVDVAIVPAGTVRDTYTKGDITVEQVYNSFSLGTGKDGLAGYPLISALFNGKRTENSGRGRCLNFRFYDNSQIILTVE